MQIHRTFSFSFVTTLAASAALLTACASSPAPGGTTPSQTTAHADTKAEPGATCDFYNYYHDESKNPAGGGKCSTDCDCDGMRSCKSGMCEGDARKEVSCNSPNRHWNEAWNTAGAGKCASDCECDGQRTCQAGSCQGTAR